MSQNKGRNHSSLQENSDSYVQDATYSITTATSQIRQGNDGMRNQNENAFATGHDTLSHKNSFDCDDETDTQLNLKPTANSCLGSDGLNDSSYRHNMKQYWEQEFDADEDELDDEPISVSDSATKLERDSPKLHAEQLPQTTRPKPASAQSNDKDVERAHRTESSQPGTLSITPSSHRSREDDAIEDHRMKIFDMMDELEKKDEAQAREKELQQNDRNGSRLLPQPGAVQISGIGPNSADDVGDDDGVAEQMRQFESMTRGTEEQQNDEQSTDVLATANTVNDAHAIFDAVHVENPHRTKRRYRVIVLLLTIILCAVITTATLVTLHFVGDRCEGDPLCCQDLDEQSVVVQCYCSHSAQETLERFSEEEIDIFQKLIDIMDRNFIIHDATPNYTSAIEKYRGDEDDDLDEEVCEDPIGLATLLMVEFGFANGLLSLEQLSDFSDDFVLETFVVAILFVSLDGIHWNQNDGWFETPDFCEWFGFNCMFLNVYDKLSLPDNGLNGTIPRELGYFSALRTLDLSGNEAIKGTIPAQLFAGFEKQNPEHEFGDEDDADTVRLYGLSQLNYLDLSGLSLEGTLPSELGNLKRLETLSISNSGLTGTIPEELFSIQTSTSTPATTSNVSMFNTDATKDETVSVRAFDRVPGNVLRTVDLSGNFLAGTIPTEIGNADRLAWLRLNSNQLTGRLPTELVSLTNLELFDVSDNLLAPTIITSNVTTSQSGQVSYPVVPDVLAQLPLLQMISLQDSGSSGYIPDTFCPNPIISSTMDEFLTPNSSSALPTTLRQEPVGIRHVKFVFECNTTIPDSALDCSCCSRKMRSTAFIQIICTELYKANDDLIE